MTYPESDQQRRDQGCAVVARSLGIATASSSGAGPAQATIGNVNSGISLVRMTGGTVAFNGFTWTLSPAHPGDTLVLWGTGGGADSANDTGGTSGDQTAAGNYSVNLDGAQITPLDSGTSSGYPGLWQVNFTLPAAIAPDCFASLTVTGGGVVSNPVTIAIAAAGQTSCSSTIPPATLSKLDSGSGTVTMAGLNIGQLVINGAVQSSAGGVINKYSVGEFLLPFIGPKVGLCSILQETYAVGTKEPSAPDAQLDAGSLTLTGPNGMPIALGKITAPTGPTYNASIPAFSLGGSYKLSASGGPGVSAFDLTATFPSSFAVTNLSTLTTINRSQPLPVSWTGSGFNQVQISITTENQSPTTIQSVTVNCRVPATQGSYTIPAAALAYLIASPSIAQLQVTADNTNGGITSAESTTDPNTVIKLAGGTLVDFGGFGPYIDYLVQPKVQ